MTKDVGRPPRLKTVDIYLCGQAEPISWDLSFNDYISIMWDLKTKAFVTIGRTTINKMHILKIDTEISPLLTMDVSSFVHSQKECAFDKGLSREEAYEQWCRSLPQKYEKNREFTLRQKSKNGN